jgi:hypothetical protein
MKTSDVVYRVIDCVKQGRVLFLQRGSLKWLLRCVLHVSFSG